MGLPPRLWSRALVKYTMSMSIHGVPRQSIVDMQRMGADRNQQLKVFAGCLVLSFLSGWFVRGLLI